MPSRVKRQSQEIVSSPSRAITVLSSSLVLRGLREFPQSSRWSVKQVFTQARTNLAISSQGHIAAYSAATRELSQRIEISDAELIGDPKSIAVPDEPLPARTDLPAVFAWHPKGKILAAASGTWEPELHVFDAEHGRLAGRFGPFRIYPTHLCWSESGRYFVVSSNGSEHSKLTLWMAGHSTEEFEPISELDSSVAAQLRTTGEDENESDGSFFGFGPVVFRPDEKIFAAVLEFDGDWSDDAVLLVKIPTLEITARLETNGQVSQLSWSSDARKLIFCASGQAYSADPQSGAITSLPFAAEMCQCHPSLPICAFYNSWSKNSAAAHIFIIDLRGNGFIDECRAEGIADIRWSKDGRMLYCVATDGTAYLFDCSNL